MWTNTRRLKVRAFVCMGLSIIATDAAASGSFTAAPWGTNYHIYGLASIEEAAEAGCFGSQKPYHADPSIWCDGSTTRRFHPNSPPLTFPPPDGWLPINTAFYYPDGRIAAGGPIGYIKAPPETKNCDPCNGIGNPIDASTGFKRQSEGPDIGEGDLQYVRTYLSGSTRIRRVTGTSWHSTFTQRISLGVHQDWALAIIRRPNGQEFSFERTAPSTAWIGDADINYRLETLASGYKLTTSEEAVEIYDAGGLLQSITTKDGRAVTLTYSANPLPGEAPKLLSVVDNYGRSLSFTYNPANATAGVGNIATITDSAGNSVFYNYDANNNLTYVTFPDGSSKTYVYNESGYTQGASLPNAMTGIVDENGERYATFGYHQSGRAISTEHAGGVDKFQFQFNFSSIYPATVVTDPFGVAHTYRFQTIQGVYKPTTISPPCFDCGGAQSISRGYDPNGNLTSETSPNGSVTNRIFDSARNLETQRTEASNDATGKKRITQTDWNAAFRVPSERRTYNAVNALVAKSIWTYNTRGQTLTSTQIDPTTNATRIVSSTYCEQSDIAAGTCPLIGLTTSIDGPLNDTADTTTYTYYPTDDATCVTSPTTCPHRKGDLWKVTNALGQVTETLRYDGAGRVLSVKDPNGVITDFEYHPRGWLTARKTRGADDASEADDQITRIEYWPTGLVKQVTQPDGALTAYTYDAAHRLTDIADNAGNQIHYVLDNAGNRIKEDIKDASGNLKHTLSRVYNQLGQLATQADAQANPTDFTYDANGNTDTITDALGRVTDNDYDPLNRLARTLQDVGGIAAETKFQYDALDNLTKVADPKGLDTTYTYNGLGDLTQLQSPDTGTTTYTYDSAGNRITQTDARGVTTQYGYDALNRLTGITYPDATLNVAYTYDTVPTACEADESFSVGRLSAMTDGSGATQYCYDRFGNTVRKVQTTNGVTFVLRYAYTLAGQLQATVYPDGTTVDYARDAQSRVTEVGVARTGNSREVLLHQATYHPFGPVAAWSYGNGRQMTRSLDQDYRPLAVQDAGTGGLSLNFGFDPVGNLTELSSGSPPPVSFAYDPLGRLTETRDGPTQTAIDTYSYDKTGNRTAYTTATGTSAYGYPTNNHRLTDVGGVIRAYDAAGNTLTIGAAKEFVYNDANRMSQVKQAGVVAMDYAYNGKGEQVRKHVGTTNTYTLYDESGHWLGDYDSTGAPLQQALWMDDLPVGLIANGNQLHYIQPDHLGTPRVVIEVVRDVPVWTWDVKGEAFGNTAPDQNPDRDANPFVFDMRFPGQRYDAASDLNQNGFREYEPIGRYTQSDPIGLQGGISSYAYSASRPTMMIDPLGLQSSLVAGGGLAEASGAAAGAYNPNASGQEFGPKINGDDVSAFIDASAMLMWMTSPAGATALLSNIASAPRRGMTRLEERQFDRHCVGSEDPCSELKKATMKAIFEARLKMNSMLMDRGNMYGTRRWGTHADDLQGRLANIAAMISLGQKLGCDMSTEIAAAAGLTLPGGPR